MSFPGWVTLSTMVRVCRYGPDMSHDATHWDSIRGDYLFGDHRRERINSRILLSGAALVTVVHVHFGHAL